MKTFDFSRGNWNQDELVHVYSYRFDDRPVFTQEDDCIRNGTKCEPPRNMGDYEYITLLTKEKYASGTKISTKCSFEDFGAPLLVITDEIVEENGELRYGRYFEVVIYEDGINVWEMWMPEEKQVKWHKLLGVKFPVAANEVHDLSMKVNKDTMEVTADGMQMTLRVAGLPEQFHVGLSGCENINRFYEMTIE